MQKTPTIPEFLSPEYCSWNLSHQIHLWRFSVRPTVSSLLTENEKEFAGRFRFEEDRNRYITGRHALRLLLSLYLRQSGEILIRSEATGKLYLSNASPGIFFNLSHSGDWVIIGFGTCEVGVDIEKIQPDFIFDDLLAEHFSQAEAHFVLSSPDPRSAFYFLWTRKEALTKAWGTGLQENLKQRDVARDIALINNDEVWTVNSMNLSADYPAAVAWAGIPRDIFYFEGGAELESRALKNGMVPFQPGKEE
jgi:4'-phosphopantetheinyl transferase